MQVQNQILDKIDEIKEKIDVFRPYPPPTFQKLKEFYKIGLTYSSNALEGNSLTESETKVVIEDGLTIGGKPMRDHFEALGHAKAFDFLLTLSQKKGFREEDIKMLHKMFYEKIDAKNAGVYRKSQVFISGSKYSLPKPENVPVLMSQFVSEMMKKSVLLHPVVAAAKIHKDFVFIHPFVDGNGRIARLLMNLILLQNGYQATIIPLILRLKYVTSLETAHVDETEFVNLILSCVFESQKEILRLLNGS